MTTKTRKYLNEQIQDKTPASLSQERNSQYEHIPTQNGKKNENDH